MEEVVVLQGDLYMIFNTFKMNPNQPQQLDPTVLNVTKAIRQVESNGNFQAQGKSGEYGAYQFMPDTWNASSSKYLGQSVPLNQATPQQQNEVAYKQIAEWKNKGYNVGQIASMWNAGEGKPNAYLDNNTGVNAQGVAFNTPDYAKKVATAYQQFKSQGQPEVVQEQTQPSSTSNPDTGFLGTNPNDSLYGKVLDNSISRGIQNIFPGKQIGQDIGTLGGYVASGFNPNYNLSAPSPLQVAGDVAQGALMIGTGMPEDSVISAFGKEIPTLATPATRLGRVGLNAGLGAAYGATGALSGGSTNIGDIARQSAIGTFTGGAAGVLGEGITSVLQNLPSRLTTSVFKQLQDPETIDYAIKNIKLGSIDSMLENSQKALNSYDGQIDSILQHPDYNPTGGVEGIIKPNSILISGDDITQKVLNQFPNSEYTGKTIFDKIRSQVPSQAATVSKLESGNITLQEANELRQAVDKVTYKTAIDSPEVKAGKDVAAKFGHALRNEVQTKAPETANIFSNYSKEIRLYRSIKSLMKSEGKKSILSMKDIVSLLGGSALGGIPGALGTELAQRVAESPVTKLAVAKTITKLAPIISNVGDIGIKAATLTPGTISKLKNPKK